MRVCYSCPTISFELRIQKSREYVLSSVCCNNLQRGDYMHWTGTTFLQMASLFVKHFSTIGNHVYFENQYKHSIYKHDNIKYFKSHIIKHRRNLYKISILTWYIFILNQLSSVSHNLSHLSHSAYHWYMLVIGSAHPLKLFQDPPLSPQLPRFSVFFEACKIPLRYISEMASCTLPKRENFDSWTKWTIMKNIIWR